MRVLPDLCVAFIDLHLVSLRLRLCIFGSCLFFILLLRASSACACACASLSLCNSSACAYASSACACASSPFSVEFRQLLVLPDPYLLFNLYRALLCLCFRCFFVFSLRRSACCSVRLVLSLLPSLPCPARFLLVLLPPASCCAFINLHRISFRLCFCCFGLVLCVMLLLCASSACACASLSLSVVLLPVHILQ